MSIRNKIITAALAVTVVITGTAAAMASPAVASYNASVRNHPGGSAVNYVSAGQPVNVVGCNGNWCKVKVPGPDGWVKASVLDFGGYDDAYYDDYYPGYYGGVPHGGACIGGPGASFCIHS